jgi:hypothetical protein
VHQLQAAIIGWPEPFDLFFLLFGFLPQPFYLKLLLFYKFLILPDFCFLLDYLIFVSFINYFEFCLLKF